MIGRSDDDNLTEMAITLVAGGHDIVVLSSHTEDEVPALASRPGREHILAAITEGCCPKCHGRLIAEGPRAGCCLPCRMRWGLVDCDDVGYRFFAVYLAAL